MRTNQHGTIVIVAEGMMDAYQIVALIGGERETTEEWVRRSWPDSFRLGPRTIRWWRSDVARYIAESHRP